MIDLHLQITNGLWIRSAPFGARVDCCPSEEVAVLNAARIAGKKDDEFRDLVAKLAAARKDAMA